MFRLGDKVEIIGTANPIRHFLDIGSLGVVIGELRTDSAHQDYYTVQSNYVIQRISPADLRNRSYDTNDQAVHLLQSDIYV